MQIINVTQYATTRKESYGAYIIHRKTLKYSGPGGHTMQQCLM